MATFKRNIPKIRGFVKEVAGYYHDETNEDERNYRTTWLFGGGELHAYCSNYEDHELRDYKSNFDGNAFDEVDGRWEGEALNRLRKRGWIFSPKLDVCICPACALKHGLIEIHDGDEVKKIADLNLLTEQQKEILFIQLSNIRRNDFSDSWLHSIKTTLGVELVNVDLDDVLAFLDMEICSECGMLAKKSELNQNEDGELACWSCRGDASFFEKNMPEDLKKKLGDKEHIQDMFECAKDFF